MNDLSNYLKNCGVTIFRGSPIQIFNGLLGWTGNGSGFLGNRNNLPANSVGFWISDRELTLADDGKHYLYPSTNEFTTAKRFPYVGFAPKVNSIPQGTLMRISLARWWRPSDSDISERCYLQLSGWYGLQNNDIQTTRDYLNLDDLPF
jgi:hypothetical protein